MNFLSEAQKKFFDEEGYLVVSKNVAYESLERAREASRRMIEKCEKRLYPYHRANGKISNKMIEKIEHVFHPDIFEIDIFKAIMDSQIAEYSNEIMAHYGHNDIFMSFNRMHTTYRYSTWQNWHRDAIELDGKTISIKATLPLYNECGFYVVPKSHKKGNKDLEGSNSTIRGHLKNEICVPVKAGDLLFFHEAIVHKGSCVGREKYRRAQIHFRFTATKYADQNPKVFENWESRPSLVDLANEQWKDLLTKKVPIEKYYEPMQDRFPKHRTKINQFFAKCYYHISTLFPQNSKLIVEPNPRFEPYLKMPKEYDSMY
ncbi:Putative phytanyol-CoA dioxygenase [Nitrosotalea devaniterrae]|uniref:Phytanyol-CoA dioxygenase n=1 Tax=Nitrosotalea devaniterrae TaxID=1078905 RepID=A0A128A0V4_9ARCH|nr:Putative phytanyol-CoA dioxygenase [Candidatus Nitrosotalea devanaterra]